VATLIIVHDADKEIATFVDADTQQGYGPAVIGPDAAQLLQEFIDALPFDAGALDSYALAAAFQSHAARMAGPDAEAASAPPAPPVEQIGDTDVAGGDKLADATAAAATDVPAPQPADTDQTASAPTPVSVVACHACQGEGKLDLGDGQGPVTCNMCQGTGKIAVPA